MTMSKAILITGCDSGFGYSLVCHMSENHPDFLTLACCYDTDSQGAKELRQKNHVRVLTVDVTQRESIEKLLKEVEVIMNVENVQLWAVVNNAATLVFADSIFQTEYEVGPMTIIHKSHCSKSSFLSKNSTLISRDNCRFFLGEKLVKMLGFWTF